MNPPWIKGCGSPVTKSSQKGTSLAWNSRKEIGYGRAKMSGGQSPHGATDIVRCYRHGMHIGKLCDACATAKPPTFCRSGVTTLRNCSVMIS